MSEQQHTAEPWFVKYQNAIFGSDNYYICSAEYGSNDHAEIDHEINRGQSVADANARRIVACVNACAGLSTQCLEETGGGVEHYIAVIKQRDELLAALEHILAGSLSLPRFAEAEAIAVIDSVKANT